MIDQIIVIRSGCDGWDVGINGSVVILVATIMLPLHLSILSPLEEFYISIFIRYRVVHVQANPSA
jgi:hypothetical protein